MFYGKIKFKVLALQFALLV